MRDKLLQKDSHDIDIALDDQSGLEFATLVNEYLKQRNLETRTIAVIQVRRVVLLIPSHEIYNTGEPRPIETFRDSKCESIGN